MKLSEIAVLHHNKVSCFEPRFSRVVSAHIGWIFLQFRVGCRVMLFFALVSHHWSKVFISVICTLGGKSTLTFMRYGIWTGFFKVTHARPILRCIAVNAAVKNAQGEEMLKNQAGPFTNCEPQCTAIIVLTVISYLGSCMSYQSASFFRLASSAILVSSSKDSVLFILNNTCQPISRMEHIVNSLRQSWANLDLNG